MAGLIRAIPGSRELAGPGWRLAAERPVTQAERLGPFGADDGWSAVLGVRRGLKLLVTGDSEMPDPLVEAWAGEPGDSSDGVAVVELGGSGLAVAQVPLCRCGTRGCRNAGIQLRKQVPAGDLSALVALLRALPWTAMVPTRSNVLRGDGLAALPVQPSDEPSKAMHHRPNMGKLTADGKHLYLTTGLPASLNPVPCPGGADMNIRSAQKRAWQNKIVKGFNTTDVPLEFCLLQGEIAEAFDAWRKGREDLGEELADVAIYLLSLAEMTGVDLQDEIEAKMAKNAVRVYRPLPNGALMKSNGAAD